LKQNVNILARANDKPYRWALLGCILILVLLLSCPGAAAFLGAGQQVRIGKYYVSSLTAPGLLFISVASCEGSVRHVRSFTISAPSEWIRDPSHLLSHRNYSGTDPNCLYS